MTKSSIVLAGGCFWGVQSDMDKLNGVVSTVVGYSGGTVENPTYEQVCTHTTGHAEAVKVEYDTAILTLENVLKFFFTIHDPTQKDRQGFDVGDNYRSAIFVSDEEQENEAKWVIEQLNATGEYAKPIATTVETLNTFWPAEEYHQKYFEKRAS
jgi:methionine-S-sulfoxide reductase